MFNSENLSITQVREDNLNQRVKVVTNNNTKGKIVPETHHDYATTNMLLTDLTQTGLIDHENAD